MAMPELFRLECRDEVSCFRTISCGTIVLSSRFPEFVYVDADSQGCNGNKYVVTAAQSRHLQPLSHQPPVDNFQLARSEGEHLEDFFPVDLLGVSGSRS